MQARHDFAADVGLALRLGGLGNGLLLDALGLDLGLDSSGLLGGASGIGFGSGSLIDLAHNELLQFVGHLARVNASGNTMLPFALCRCFVQR